MKTKQTIVKSITALFSVSVIFAIILLASSCGSGGLKAGEIDTTRGLKDFYAKFFPIGVAVAPNSLEGETGEMIKKHFNSITASNVMKPQLLQPEEGVWNWEPADKIVDFAMANGMKVRGHTLCWHSQTGAWMWVDTAGNPASKELAMARLKEHITQVVTRYKGKVYAWDVLNEVISDRDTGSVYRMTPWLKICGEEYIPAIFRWAHEADPDAILYYNDYNTENPGKRERIYNMVKKLQEDGVPIHGVGLQAHWNVGDPSADAIRESIEKFASLGLDVQFTELDVTIYTSRNDTIGTGFTPEREQRQIDFYKNAFSVFREKKENITGVTFWNVSDRGSWLDRRGPASVTKVYPLLFDSELQPKKAFWEVVRF